MHVIEVWPRDASIESSIFCGDVIHAHYRWCDDRGLTMQPVLIKDNREGCGLDGAIFLVEGDCSEIESNSGRWRKLEEVIGNSKRICSTQCLVTVAKSVDPDPLVSFLRVTPRGGGIGAFDGIPCMTSYLMASNSQRQLKLPRHKESWEELEWLAAIALSTQRSEPPGEPVLQCRLSPAAQAYCKWKGKGVGMDGYAQIMDGVF